MYLLKIAIDKIVGCSKSCCLILLLNTWFSIGLMAQNDTIIVQENIAFSVADKPMWGPNTSFSINQHFELIPKKELDVSLPFPPPKFDLLGGSFGFDIEASLYMSFGLGFYFKDFTTGSVDIDFPIDINFDVPAFNAGDIAIIKTSFTVRDEAAIKTTYPNAGRIGMTTDFAIRSRLAFGVCFYDCLSPFSLFESVPLPDGLNTLNPIKDGALVIDTTDPESLFSLPVDTLFQISQKEGESFIIGKGRKPIFGESGLGIPSILCKCDPNDDLPGIPTIEKSRFDLLPFEIDLDAPDPLDCEEIIDRREEDDMIRKNDSIQAEIDKMEADDDKAQADADDDAYDDASDDEKKEIDKRRKEREDRKKKRNTRAYNRATRFLRALQAMEGSFDIPSVTTSRPAGNLGSNDRLIAEGEDMYVNANFKLLKALKDVPYIGLLNAKVLPPPPIDCLGEIEYSIFDIETDFSMTNKQEFSFYPTVLVKLDLPEALDYAVIHPDGNITAARGTSVTYESGAELNIKFPCNFEFLDLKPTYSIQSGKANFSNHTFDTYALGLRFKALSFKLKLNSVVLLPAICIPEICIPLLGCTPEICTPEIKSPSLDLPLGPVLDEPVPIASPSVDWFNQEWEIDGFQEIEGDTFRIAPRKFNIDLLAKNLPCKDANNGEIALTKTGGTEPITYSWSNGETTKDLKDLAAGVYFLTAEDKNGCAAYASIEVTEPELLTVTPEAKSIGCFGNSNGNISLDVKGGEGPYLYLWSNGAVSKDLEGLNAGTYSVEVTDAAGCTVNAVVEVEEALPLEAAAVDTNDPSCMDATDGVITLSVSGGTAPYQYNWSNGRTEKEITGLSAGDYSVEITDNNGCKAMVEVSLTAPNLLTASLSVTAQNNCFGEAKGALNLTPEGGTAPYTYQWFRGTEELNLDVASPGNLLAGNYTVVVTDAGGCQVTTSAEITQTDQRLVSRISAEEVSCAGGSDGRVNLSVDGGDANYAFNWNSGETSQNLTDVPAGVYTVTITDTNGCETENSVIVFEPTPLQVQGFVTNERCEGDEDGKIELLTIGGVEPYRFEWLHGSDQKNIESLAPGSYQVLVLDNNQCSVVNTFEVATADEDCIAIPTVFSPNGDGINDTWILRNMDLNNAKLKVFNKWGLEVFSTVGYARPWDGTHNGSLVPSGTYYYILDPANGESPMNGSITLIR